jgi:hypothetical protein
MPSRLRAGELCASGRHVLTHSTIGRRSDGPWQRCLPCHALAQARYKRRQAGLEPPYEPPTYNRWTKPWMRQERELLARLSVDGWEAVFVPYSQLRR